MIDTAAEKPRQRQALPVRNSLVAFAKAHLCIRNERSRFDCRSVLSTAPASRHYLMLLTLCTVHYYVPSTLIIQSYAPHRGEQIPRYLLLAEAWSDFLHGTSLGGQHIFGQDITFFSHVHSQ